MPEYDNIFIVNKSSYSKDELSALNDYLSKLSSTETFKKLKIVAAGNGINNIIIENGDESHQANGKIIISLKQLQNLSTFDVKTGEVYAPTPEEVIAHETAHLIHAQFFKKLEAEISKEFMATKNIHDWAKYGAKKMPKEVAENPEALKQFIKDLGYDFRHSKPDAETFQKDLKLIMDKAWDKSFTKSKDLLYQNEIFSMTWEAAYRREVFGPNAPNRLHSEQEQWYVRIPSDILKQANEGNIPSHITSLDQLPMRVLKTSSEGMLGRPFFLSEKFTENLIKNISKLTGTPVEEVRDLKERYKMYELMPDKIESHSVNGKIINSDDISNLIPTLFNVKHISLIDTSKVQTITPSYTDTLNPSTSQPDTGKGPK